MNPTSKVSPSSTVDTSTTAVEKVGSTSHFSLLHPDIIESHILTRLDGPSLATASCSSTTLYHLSSASGRHHQLWSHICHSTWPSTASPAVYRFISTFPDGGPRAFFAHSFPLPVFDPPAASSSSSCTPPSEIISAVDIQYKNELVFSKVQETETVTGWFRCSPFRIDLLEPKVVIPTSIRHPEGDDACSALMEDMSLSWILIDPEGQRAMNLSSQKPVSVQRHWLSGEVQVRFALILAVAGRKKGSARWGQGRVQCGIVVTCGKSEDAEMQVREVSMEMEDMDGMHLNGRDSLVILQGALKGKRGKAVNREEEGRKRYKEYVEMKKERKEWKLRTEWALDIFCVAFGVSIFVVFWCFFWCK